MTAIGREAVTTGPRSILGSQRRRAPGLKSSHVSHSSWRRSDATGVLRNTGDAYCAIRPISLAHARSCEVQPGVSVLGARARIARRSSWQPLPGVPPSAARARWTPVDHHIAEEMLSAYNGIPMDALAKHLAAQRK
jgi:hypothetical protein